ncbi:Crp/Fnr family transcriptional regulator [Bergeyella zoohelcum]|uniref:Crp/Fnr family transcriptional regulator n=1 Tax=Bergeyella zoohelcum TaxID=1015 RepID=UPI002A91D9FA|nr:Crp/Fnr family transcriptional regulator [Bergeyella zoohelcum]MDY6026273.1 Crp/Fnr family transcriptional regulator [Bergeyella zoohelcum]
MQETIMKPSDDFISFFDESSLEHRIPECLLKRVKEHKVSIKYNKGEHLFDEKESPEAVYIIKSGTAKLSKVGAYKKEQILKFITEGDLIGYRSLLCGESFRAKAEALTEVEALKIPSDLFVELLQEDKSLAFEMLKKIAYELGESCDTITFLAQKTVRERLAEMLLTLEQKLGTDPEGFIKITLTREEIANLIGTATESAIRLISEFKSDKIIETEGRNIKIIDREKLMKLGHV